MACKFWIVCLISVLGRLSFADNCSPTVTEGHLDYLKEMIDGQLISTCTIPVEVLGRSILDNATPEKKTVAEYCHMKGILLHLSTLLDYLQFKPNSRYFNYTMELKDLYTEEIFDCVTEDDIRQCIQTTQLTTIELLERVNESFLIAQTFTENSAFDRECTKLYKQCKIQSNNEGSQCACPSPAAINTQKSVSDLSESKSSTYSTAFPHHSIPMVEDFSATPLYKPASPQKNPQGLGPSSASITDTSSEKQTLTTIMDLSHYVTTVYPEANTESSHKSMDLAFITTKVPKGINHPLSTTINPSQYDYRVYVSKDPSNSESLLSVRDNPTTEIPSAKTHFLKYGEFIAGTKPDDGQILETTEGDIISQSTIMDRSHYATTAYPEANTESSHKFMDLALITTKVPKGITHQLTTAINPSQYDYPLYVRKDPSNSKSLLSIRVTPTTEIPSSNAHFLQYGEFLAGTKPDNGELLETTEGDIVSQSSNMPISETYLSKPSKEPAIESSSSSVTKMRRSLVDVDYTSRVTMKTPTFSAGGLATSELPQSVSQEKGAEEKNLGWASSFMSSSTSGITSSYPGSDSVLAEVSQPHLTTTHKTRYTQYTQERVHTSDNRENSFAAPDHSSNQLPIIETEKLRHGGKEENNLFIPFTIFLSIMGLLCLCGLLYYRFHYRLLKRQHRRECDLQLQEARPLRIIIDEV